MFDRLKDLVSRQSLLYALVISVVFAGAFAYTFDSKVDLNGDNAKYYLLAKSIAQGKGYVNVTTPGQPPTSIYPPGYPLLASGVMIFTESIFAQKVLNGLFLLGAGLLLFLILRRITEEDLLSASIAVLSVINFHLLKFSVNMMSEASFTFFSLLALLFLMRSRGNEPPWKSLSFCLFVATLTFSVHIRTQGVGLVGGVLFYFLLTYQWTRFGVTTAGVVLLMLPWRLRNYVQDLGSSRYLDQLVRANPWQPEQGQVSVGGLLERFIDQGAMLITKGIPDSLFNFITVNYQSDAAVWGWVLGLLVLGVVLYGFWCLQPYRWLFIGYFLAVFTIVALWSATVDNRYLVTLIPILQAGFFYGAYRLLWPLLRQTGAPLRPSWALPGVILVVGGLMLPGLSPLNVRAEKAYPPPYRNFFQSANELKQQAGCGDTLVSSRKPFLFYLFSSCYSTRYAFEDDSRKLIRNMVDKEVDYVVLAQLGYSSTGRYLYPAIQQHSDLFPVVINKKTPNTYVLKFRRRAAQRALGRQ